MVRMEVDSWVVIQMDGDVSCGVVGSPFKIAEKPDTHRSGE